MSKKIIGIILIVIIFAIALYAKYYYPNSQFQLKNSLRSVIATPIEHFYNATETSCGVWYERKDADNTTVTGKSNSEVLRCFKSAFEKCDVKNILFVKDNGLNDAGSITYAFVRVIRANDDGKCIVQNSLEEYSHAAPAEQIPLNYINTCTVLSEDTYSSCEPQYIKDQRNSAGVTIE